MSETREPKPGDSVYVRLSRPAPDDVMVAVVEEVYPGDEVRVAALTHPWLAVFGSHPVRRRRQGGNVELGQMSEGAKISTIYPTGTCFDDALDTLAEFLRRRLHKQEDLLLVHGICLAPRGTIHADEPFAHAWVEVKGEEVWQSGLAKEFPDSVVKYAVSVAEFYEEMRVQECTKYTPRQASLENKRSNTYGPWLPQYQALCGKRRTFWPVGKAQ